MISSMKDGECLVTIQYVIFSKLLIENTVHDGNDELSGFLLALVTLLVILVLGSNTFTTDTALAGFPAGTGHLTFCSRWLLGHRFSPLMLYPNRQSSCWSTTPHMPH